MIELPESGLSRSVNQPNISRNALADWLEATILFNEKHIGKSDIVDMLVEYEICPNESQDIAYQIANIGWDELCTRQRWGGIPSELIITESSISSQCDWTSDPIRAFLVLLSIQPIYPTWAKRHANYSAQGLLFERVVEAICPALLPGWNTYRVGWSPTQSASVAEVVEEMTTRVFVLGASDLSQWSSNRAKDSGLDIVCYRSFDDQREALPMYLLQCASGKNWVDKVGTPNAEIWYEYLDSAVRPSTGIAAPFVIDEFTLRQNAKSGQQIIFDRLRMLGAMRSESIVLPNSLLSDVITWVSPRAGDLPISD